MRSWGRQRLSKWCVYQYCQNQELHLHKPTFFFAKGNHHTQINERVITPKWSSIVARSWGRPWAKCGTGAALGVADVVITRHSHPGGPKPDRRDGVFPGRIRVLCRFLKPGCVNKIELGHFRDNMRPMGGGAERHIHPHFPPHIFNICCILWFVRDCHLDDYPPNKTII